MAGVSEGFAGILRLQWVSFWRRFSRGGTSAKNSVVLTALLAAGLLARYIAILKDTAAGARKGQFGELDLLTAAIFVLCVSPLWDAGSRGMGPRDLARFPLTARERLIARIWGGLVSPICWLAALVCVSLAWPLAAAPHPLCGLIAGLTLVVGSVMAGYSARHLFATSQGRVFGRVGALVLLAAAVMVWLRMGRGSAAALELLPPHLVILGASGSWLACGALALLALVMIWCAGRSLTWMLERAPATASRKIMSSPRMTVFTKDLRYFRGLELVIWLILLGLGSYLVTAAAPEPDAVRAVIAFTSIVAIGAAMNSFGADGPAGLDRYGLWPLSGFAVITTKNRAQAVLALARWAPITVLALWRFGWREGMYDGVEAASLLLASLAWGNMTSVLHPYSSEEAASLFDQVIGLAASALPGMITIGALRGPAGPVPLVMFGMLGICALLYAFTLRWASTYYSREFDLMRQRISA